MDSFQEWARAEVVATAKLRRHKMKLFGRIVLVIILVALLVGGVYLLPDLLAASGADEAPVVLAGVLFAVVFVSLLVFLAMLPSFLPGGYLRRIKKSARRYGFSDEQRQELGRDLLAAGQQPGRRAELLLCGYGQGNLPAWFIMGDKYACLIGGMNFGPYFAPLAEVDRIQVEGRPQTENLGRDFFSRGQEKTSWRLNFMRRGQCQSWLRVDDRESLSRILALLRRQQPGWFE